MFVGIQISGQIVNSDKHLPELVFPDPETQFSLLYTAVELRIGFPEDFSSLYEADSLSGVHHCPDSGAA